MLNVSLICLSLKYIKKNYELVSKVSKWINFELGKHNYKESKFIESLDMRQSEVIEILINFNENIDLLSNYLFNFCLGKNNYSHIVKLLIDHGVNIHIQNNHALIWASYYGNYDIVKLLIDDGADIRAQGNKALINACRAGHFDIIKLLIDNGADIHARNNKAIRYARLYRHEDIVFF